MVFWPNEDVDDTHHPQSSIGIMTVLSGDLGHMRAHPTRGADVTFLNGPKGPEESP
jgi:hypothetical protein